MKPATLRRRVCSFGRDESGQVLPLVTVMLTVMLGMAALAIDVGHCMYSYRRLQAATNAAALAGAAALTCPPNQACSSNSGVTAATAFSALSGNANASSTLPGVTMVSGYPAQKCLTSLQSQGMACAAPTYANAVAVKQTINLPMYFAGILGKKTMTLTASATASMRGASPVPTNVAVIIDQTLSMNTVDSNCGNNTQIACAMNGVQLLLKALDPCARSQTTCQIANGVAANSVDRVSMFTFPEITTASVANAYNCSGQPFVDSLYTFPTANASSYSPIDVTYQVTPFLSDYKTSYSATTLNPNSELTAIVGAKSGCAGMTPQVWSSGFVGTYYASVIYAAQSALHAQQAANPGSQNVMILLSDGDATAPNNWYSWQAMQQNTQCGFGIQSVFSYGSYNGYWCGLPGLTYSLSSSLVATGNGYYPSWVGECGQAIVAAKYATAAGTRVYTVAYGAPPTGCASDANAGQYPNISPCNAMAAMASATQYFFSDYNQSGSGSTCVASQPVTALNDIFTQIAGDMTAARLIPDNTQ